MIEKSECEDEIELADVRNGKVIDGGPLERDVQPKNLCREPRLRDLPSLRVDAEHPGRAKPLGLETVEAGVAADVQHALPRKIGRQVRLEELPCRFGMVARFVRARSELRFQLRTEIDVVKPGVQRPDSCKQATRIGVGVGVL